MECPGTPQVQTIAFLSHLRQRSIYGPFLVLGPLSTLPNWVSEFRRWCPEQPVQLYHGSKPERAELRSAWKGAAPAARTGSRGLRHPRLRG